MLPPPPNSLGYCRSQDSTPWNDKGSAVEGEIEGCGAPRLARWKEMRF